MKGYVQNQFMKRKKKRNVHSDVLYFTVVFLPSLVKQKTLLDRIIFDLGVL